MAAPRQVLVVEDDKGIRDLVAMALDEVGYEVVSAADGAAALDRLATLRPVLILLDMRMPVMDGWEFARAYAHRPGHHAPVIIMSAARDAASHAAEVKAEGYLAKPFNLEDLYACVEQFAGGRSPGGAC